MIVTVTLNPALDRTLTVESILFNEVLRAAEVRLDWGGKGFNVSRALKALGAESLAMGFTGGATGQLLAQGLNELGIPTAFTPVIGETRTNVVVIEAATGKHVKVNEAGPVIQPQELDGFLEEVRGKASPGDYWVFSGSLPPGAPRDFYANLIQAAQARGARAVLDASGAAFRLGCSAAPYLIKPNLAEAEEVLGIKIEPESGFQAAVDFFLQQGVQFVALSLGAAGLFLASRQQSVLVRPPSVQISNSVGAGDALLAGLLWAFQRGYDLEQAARWGVACGTAAAMQAGVSVGTYAEVEAVYQSLAGVE